MRRLPQRVEASILRHDLLRPRQKVLVAVSGGVDSMILLHVLHRLARKHSWELYVAHLNHQLRGRSSDADERLVVREARRLKLPVTVERAPIRSLARSKKVSVEMAAREVRHEFLAQTALRLAAHSVALAHHADDQLELFFLRLLRGSGTDGLGGMRWRSPSPSHPEVELVRPLLDVAKTELRTWAKEQGIRFREDATNASLDYQRNRIRHELIPLLRRRFQPALDRTVSRLMDVARAEAEFLNAEAERSLGSARGAFGRLPIALQRRRIQMALLRVNIRPEFELVERLRTGRTKAVMVARGKSVSLTPRGRLRVRGSVPAIRKAGEDSSAEIRVKLDSLSGHAQLGRVEFRWRISRSRSGVPSKKGTQCENFDAGRVGETVVLRYWRPGDRMQPIGMTKRVKLQDLFTNSKIPRDERHKRVILTTRRGEIVWVEGLRISERFKLSRHTNRRLHWQWKRL